MDRPLQPGSPNLLRGFRRAQWGLAGVVVGLSILIAVRGYAPSRARPTELRPAAVTHQVDLNRAERSELLSIPGIGPGLADAILTHRQSHGQFAQVDDLQGVKGIGGKTLDKVRPWVTVSTPTTEPAEVERLERKPVVRSAPTGPVKSGKIQAGEPPIDPNRATLAELQRLPGVGPVMAGKIIEARERQAFRAIEDLRHVKGIGVKTLEAIRPYIAIEPPKGTTSTASIRSASLP